MATVDQDHPACKNCQNLLEGPYCHECGQSTHDPRVSVGVWFRAQVSELLSLETRLTRSLWLLFSRPGRLTREWVQGRRIRYVPPLRLYLLVSAVFLALSFVFGFPLLDLPPARSLEGSEHALAYRAAQDAFEGDVRIAVVVCVVVLVPLLGLILKLVNLEKRSFLVDHLVFALHFLTAVVAFTGVGWIAMVALPPWYRLWSILTAWIVSGVYFFFALRKSWDLSLLSTAVRTTGVVLILAPLLPTSARLGTSHMAPSFRQWVGVYRDAVAVPAYARWRSAASNGEEKDSLLRAARLAYLQVEIMQDLDPEDTCHLMEMHLASGANPRFARIMATDALQKAPYDLLALGWAAEVSGLAGDSVGRLRYLERFNRAYESQILKQMQRYPLHIPDLERFRQVALEAAGSSDH